MLEHVTPGNDRLALLEMARVLKPGGTLILTFDVAPPPPADEGDVPWPAERRRFAKPFNPRAARRLFGALTRAYSLEDAERMVPQELDSLTWDELRAFWRAAQQHDERDEPEREYLALAGTLTRSTHPITMSGAEQAEAYLEGQQAIDERLGWFQHRAAERLLLVDSLSQRATAYQVQLREKEELIQDLEAAARARLEVAHELGRQLSAAHADTDTRASIDRLGYVLAEQSLQRGIVPVVVHDDRLLPRSVFLVLRKTNRREFPTELAPRIGLSTSGEDGPIGLFA